MTNERGSYDCIKRGMDIAVSAAGLIVTSPLLIAVAGLVRARLGTPVMFRQTRPGKDGQIFKLVKFRTMLEPEPERGLVTDGQRLTALGGFLRSTSLDELPSLWNVLRGDMSLVGPRPLLPEYLRLYTPRQATRHAVRPGITGLAQSAGRNAVSWDDRLELDARYVESRSFGLDLRILVATVVTVVRRDGITHDGHVTMPRFVGTPQAVSLPGMPA